MKILYVSSTNIWGGATVALYGLLKYMHERGHEVLVFTPSNKGRFIEELERINVKWYAPKRHYQVRVWIGQYKLFTIIKWVIKWMFRIGFINWAAKKSFLSVVEDFKPDIVHTNVGPLDIAFDICRHYHIPHVWHMREYQDKDFGMHFIPTQKSFRKKILSFGNYNIAITKEIFQYWNLRPQTDEVIYDGVFSNIILPTTYIKNKKNYIIFVGRIEPAKDPLTLIKAYQLYVERNGRSNYDIFLVGNYTATLSYKNECDSFIEQHHLTEKVHYLGHRNDVYDLISNAACMVVPSLNEGFGFITVEAMLNHCPVIGRYTGGTKEQIDNGYQYEKGPIALTFETIEELSQKIEYALNSDLSEMIDRAYDMVTTHYSNEICGSNTEQFYNKVLNMYQRTPNK